MAGDHTVIVGGGVIGVCCAYALARRGAPVTVLERDEVGRAASWGNAGSFWPGHAPINRPGRVRQGIRWMFDELSPLYIPPRFDTAMMKWLWSFRAFCTPEHFLHCMRVLGALGHRSDDELHRIMADEALSCEYLRVGPLEAYLDPVRLGDASQDVDLLASLGYPAEVLSGDALREREPAFTAAVRGGIRHEKGASCNPYRFVTGLAERARQHGAVIREGVTVSEVVTAAGKARGVRTSDGDVVAADTVLLSTGSYSGELLARLGLPLPIQPGKGYHRDVTPGPGAAPALRSPCLLADASIFCTPMGDFVRFAGTLEFSGVSSDIRPKRLAQLSKGAALYFEGIGAGGTRSEWCGLRPCLPDGLPAIGWVPGVEGVFVANGHAMMGLTLGPVTGLMAADAILDRNASPELAALAPGRFAGLS